MQPRGLSSLTQEAYPRSVRRFSEFLGRRFRDANARDDKRYLHHLMSEKRFFKQTVNQNAAAMSVLLAMTKLKGRLSPSSIAVKPAVT